MQHGIRHAPCFRGLLPLLQELIGLVLDFSSILMVKGMQSCQELLGVGHGKFGFGNYELWQIRSSQALQPLQTNVLNGTAHVDASSAPWTGIAIECQNRKPLLTSLTQSVFQLAFLSSTGVQLCAGQPWMWRASASSAKCKSQRADTTLAAITRVPPSCHDAGVHMCPPRRCLTQFAKYICPRCNTSYCCLACYKRHSSNCTEAFSR